MAVTLIGYRGTGKTSVAPRLADKLGWDWIDADAEIERRADTTIRRIFDTEGEAGFRARERALLAELLQHEELVLAAGGGAVLDPQTRDDMRSSGPVVWLQASPETIHDRINSDATTAQRRPQLTADGGRAEIEELLSRREPLYRQCATHAVDTSRCTVEAIVEAILPHIRQLPPHSATSR